MGAVGEFLGTVVLVVPDDDPKTWQDFRAIAAAIRDHGMRAHLVRHRRHEQLALLPLWLTPTVSISISGRTDRKLLPGRFLSGLEHSKVDEYRTLQAAGAPVPRWTELAPDTRLNPGEWGPYVIEKPSAGWLGANIRVRKTEKVRFTPPSSYERGHYGRHGPMIVQKFVYTGEWPVSYRVVTVFGEVVLCYRQVTQRGTPLTTRWGFDAGGTAVISNTRAMRIELDANAEIMDAARRAHLRAFPDVPLLQFDIGKDVETGELAIFECHPFAPLWPFSHRMAISAQAANAVDFDSQFGAMTTTGRAIAKKAAQILH